MGALGISRKVHFTRPTSALAVAVHAAGGRVVCALGEAVVCVERSPGRLLYGVARRGWRLPRPALEMGWAEQCMEPKANRVRLPVMRLTWVRERLGWLGYRVIGVG